MHNQPFLVLAQADLCHVQHPPKKLCYMKRHKKKLLQGSPKVQYISSFITSSHHIQPSSHKQIVCNAAQLLLLPHFLVNKAGQLWQVKLLKPDRITLIVMLQQLHTLTISFIS